MKYLKQYRELNESIKDSLKPKSIDNIVDKIKHLSPDKKLENGVRFNVYDVVKIAIEEGADVRYDNDWYLRMSCRYGYTDIAKLLIDNGCDVHVMDDYPIKSAFFNKHMDTVDMLVKNGADIEKTKNNYIQLTSVVDSLWKGYNFVDIDLQKYKILLNEVKKFKIKNSNDILIIDKIVDFYASKKCECINIYHSMNKKGYKTYSISATMFETTNNEYNVKIIIHSQQRRYESNQTLLYWCENFDALIKLLKEKEIL